MMEILLNEFRKDKAVNGSLVPCFRRIRERKRNLRFERLQGPPRAGGLRWLTSLILKILRGLGPCSYSPKEEKRCDDDEGSEGHATKTKDLS